MAQLMNHKMSRYLRYFIIFVTLGVIYLYSTRDYHVPGHILPLQYESSFFKSRHLCPDYLEYSQARHKPFSEGKLRLPFQRPQEKCRTFRSSAVETLISDFQLRLENSDLARLFENCLPNTLDTTILWHKNQSTLDNIQAFDHYIQTFVVTGDIHAEWLRDSAWQLSVYQKLAPYDPALKRLIEGAINLQARYIINDPYCNAFHPPHESGVKRGLSAEDDVFPKPDWDKVFECKWELDSLASFLSITNQYYASTKDEKIFSQIWQSAMEVVFLILERESVPTFDQGGLVVLFRYSFQRQTNVGSETLPLTGSGNPVNRDTSFIRSAFRPSDDACVFQFFIPANAYLVAELKKLHDQVPDGVVEKGFKSKLEKYYKAINESIYTYGVFEHPEFGQVLAYEVDGYGSALFMDDANIPSLLSLPDLGFIDRDSQLYQNTRKMVLSKRGNPYYLVGRDFKGIGGPHVGYRYAWPMSSLVKIRTSDDDEEILRELKMVMRSTGTLGLMHEGVNVNSRGGADFTRSWFAWCNSEFGKTVLDIALRKPHLIFKEGYGAYNIDEQFGKARVKGDEKGGLMKKGVDGGFKQERGQEQVLKGSS